MLQIGSEKWLVTPTKDRAEPLYLVNICIETIREVPGWVWNCNNALESPMPRERHHTQRTRMKRARVPKLNTISGQRGPGNKLARHTKAIPLD